MQVALLGRDAVLVSQAAREAARTAAVTTSDAEVEAAAAGTGLARERTSVEIVRGGHGGDPVTVRVVYEAPVGLPMLMDLLPPAVTLTGEVTTRQEVP